jgi:hypothetical protein
VFSVLHTTFYTESEFQDLAWQTTHYPTSFILLFSKLIITQLVWHTFTYALVRCHMQFSPKKAQVFQAEQGGTVTMLLLVPVSEALGTNYPISVH